MVDSERIKHDKQTLRAIKEGKTSVGSMIFDDKTGKFSFKETPRAVNRLKALEFIEEKRDEKGIKRLQVTDVGKNYLDIVDANNTSKT